MALSVVDLYRKILPKTNCRECGYKTCLAFASMVVAEKLPIQKCPHIPRQTAENCQLELDEQHAAGKWTRRDLAADALIWAKERAASMVLAELPERIGGNWIDTNEGGHLRLPYFTDAVLIGAEGISREDGTPLNRWEQVFIYNHMAQGGRRDPTGVWKGLEAFPNTVSKIKSMRNHVEAPLVETFEGKASLLKEKLLRTGGVDLSEDHPQADLAFVLRPLPKVPVLLLFWDSEPEVEGKSADGFGARVKLLFDETIIEHLDIESILFLSEHIGGILRGEAQ
jgi:hypothetical protein